VSDFVGWLILLGYVAGFIYTARRVKMWLDDDWRRSFNEDPDAGTAIIGAALGFMTGLIWPITLAVLLLSTTGRRTELARKIDTQAREDRIRELERELLRRDGGAP
jgi:hypothetical protein